MDKAKWWEDTKTKYPFFAESPTAIKPHMVKDCGQHASVVLKPAWRQWGFENETDRDKFVVQYHAFKTQ